MNYSYLIQRPAFLSFFQRTSTDNTTYINIQIYLIDVSNQKRSQNYFVCLFVKKILILTAEVNTVHIQNLRDAAGKS